MRMCHTDSMWKATLLLICGAALAQSPPATDVPKDDPSAVIRTSVNVVIAPTTVRDKKGDFVDGLQLQDFQLYDNNRLQKVTADVRDEPLSLVIAVQKSSNLNDV